MTDPITIEEALAWADESSHPDTLYHSRYVNGAVHVLAAEVRRLQLAKNGAYSERNKLVAALSMMFPASLERHPEEDKTWEDDWRWVVYLDLPTGQASWHLHDSEVVQFGHLPRMAGRKWDGHTTEEKYSRLAKLSVYVF